MHASVQSILSRTRTIDVDGVTLTLRRPSGRLLVRLAGQASSDVDAVWHELCHAAAELIEEVESEEEAGDLIAATGGFEGPVGSAVLAMVNAGSKPESMREAVEGPDLGNS